MSDNTEGQTKAELDESLKHNKITQADYDQAISRARKMEGQAVTYEKQVKEYQKFGSVEELAAKLAKLDGLEVKTTTNPDDTSKLIQSRIAETLKQVQPKIEAAESRAKAAEERLHKIEVVDKAMDTVSKEFLPSAAPLIKEVYISKYVRRNDEGELIAVDDAGQPRYIGAKPMALTDLLAEIKEKHPDLAAGKPSNNSRPAGEIKAGKIAGGAFDPRKYQAMTDKREKALYLRQFSTYTNQGK